MQTTFHAVLYHDKMLNFAKVFEDDREDTSTFDRKKLC
jgi:hypothetical protein